MTPNSIVRLEVAGTQFAGWKKVEITAGLDRAARDFSLEVTDKFPGEAVALVARRIEPGELCKVWIGADLVLTGFVDATPVSYDGRSVSLAVKGRSRTADLVDCSVVNLPGQWSNRKAEDIARDMAGQYGVSVICAADTGAVLPDHQVQQGETVMASLSRILSLRQLLATDDAAGNLVICRAGSGNASTPLVLGDNILSASAELDAKDRFSEYIVRGQAAGGDLAFASQVSGLEGKATDPGVKRRRVLIKTADGNADTEMCRKEAAWEGAHRAGKAFETTYTVQGWRQSDGRLWLPNQMVMVRDSVIGFNLSLLIGEVTYSLSDQGSFAKLKVAPKGAWELAPQIPQGTVAHKGGDLVKFEVPGQDQTNVKQKPELVRF